jgi:hypothetical protein
VSNSTWNSVSSSLPATHLPTRAEPNQFHHSCQLDTFSISKSFRTIISRPFRAVYDRGVQPSVTLERHYSYSSTRAFGPHSYGICLRMNSQLHNLPTPSRDLPLERPAIMTTLRVEVGEVLQWNSDCARPTEDTWIGMVAMVQHRGLLLSRFIFG